MQRNGFPSLIGLLAATAVTLLVQPTPAQPPPGSQLPNPRLFTVTPGGAKLGTTVEVTFTGQDVEDPQGLLFSHPGIKAEPIVPPTPPAPPPDPKTKKAAPPPPRPPVTRFKVTVSASTPVGIHDVRLINKWGISNPRAFVVGDLAEVAEKEPNNDVEQAQRVELNTTVTGTIASPVDVDYFIFKAQKGQRVLVSCLTSSIDSRLAPALEIYTPNGRLLTQTRDYQGNDALADVTIPADGDYLVRLFEFTHTSGSPEHFYRLSITTAPWIDAVFPPVIEPGKTAQVTVYGRNLPGGKPDPSAVVDGRVLDKLPVTVNAPTDPAARERLTFHGLVSPLTAELDGFEYRVRNAAGTSNPFLLTYAHAPVVPEQGVHDTPEKAQEVPVPCEIAGRIEKRRDRDWYSFTAKKGDVFNIELYSERLGAPTDMRFTLRNPATKQDFGEFDDNPDTLTPFKFVTRTTDPPRYRFAAPADGKYQLLVTAVDGETRAGPRHLYRVRITPDRPDFRLVALHPAEYRPDATTLRQGGQIHYQVLAYRLDGFNGPITLSAEGLPSGVICPPQVMGTGLRQATLVLSAAADALPFSGEIKIKGTATINGQSVMREARPASVTWPVQPQAGIPAITRLDRNLVLAVRDKAPWSVSISLDKPALVHGDKANLTAKLTRLWPDFKQPLQLQAVDLPPGLVVNNNQPITIAPNVASAALPVIANPNVPPGSYNIVLRGTAQIPFNKDPKAPQKPPTNIVQVSMPLTVIVAPKQVATVAVANPNMTVKVGMQAEVVVRVTRQFDYAGAFKVSVVLPPAIKGLSIPDATIPAGQNETKLMVKVAPDAAPGNRPDLLVRATAVFVPGNVTTTQEVKFAVNVVK
jgi:hypothetical protein